MYESLQVCRAVAALLVVLFHLGGALASDKYFHLTTAGRALVFGHSGVAFFFVLSGFIITHVHRADIGHPDRLGTYIKKRAARIYPPFLVVFTGVFAMAWIAPSLRSTLPDSASILLKALLLLPQDPAVVGGTGAPVIIVAWSLHYEILFYALFALAIANRTLSAAVLLALVANGASCLWSTSCTFPRTFLASHWMLLFLAGCAIDPIARRMSAMRLPLTLAATGVAGFAAIAAIEVVQRATDTPWLYIGYGLCSAIIVLGLVIAEEARTVKWRHAVAGALGDSSYALYLLHYPIISILCKAAVSLGLSGWAGGTVSFVAILASCVFLANLFHRLIERPILNTLNRQLKAFRQQ